MALTRRIGLPAGASTRLTLTFASSDEARPEQRDRYGVTFAVGNASIGTQKAKLR